VEFVALAHQFDGRAVWLCEFDGLDEGGRLSERRREAHDGQHAGQLLLHV